MSVTQSKFGTKQIAIVILTFGTALIHISLLFPDMLFILNGLGFLVLLAAYFLPLPFVKDHRNIIRWLFIAYTGVTILAWVAIGNKSWPEGALGYVTKLIEVIIIALLWTDKPE